MGHGVALQIVILHFQFSSETLQTISLMDGYHESLFLSLILGRLSSQKNLLVFSTPSPQALTCLNHNRYDGNAFNNGPAPPPPPYTPPPPGKSHKNRGNSPGSQTPPDSGGKSSNSSNGSKKGLTAGPIIGIIVGSLLLLLFVVLVFVFCVKKGKKKENSIATSGGRLPVILEKGMLPFCYVVYSLEKLASLEGICTFTSVLMI